MAQPKDELYCITDEMGRCARVNNGTVQFVSTITPLPVSPDGWQEKSIKYARNMTSLGMWRTFTTPLKYVKEAALIVRDQLYRFGTERKLYQVIHRLNKAFGGGWVHKFFYRGELDLSQADDSDTDMTVNIMEGDLIKMFKAYESTEYEIDIDVPDAVTVKADGTFLSEKHNFLIPGDINLAFNHLLFTAFLNKEGNAFGVSSSTVYGHLGYPNFADSTEYFFAVSQDILGMKMKGQVSFTCTGSAAHYYLRLMTDTGRTLTVINDEFVTQGNTYTFDFDYTFDAFAGEKFFLVNGTQNNIFFVAQYKETQFSISFLSRYKTTFIKGLRPVYVAQKLLDKMTGGGYTFNSSYLSTEWENLLLTCGDAIRGIAGAKLKISWSDFYSGYNVPCNLTEGIRNQVLYIEKKSDAFQPTIQLALGRVRDMKPSTAKAKEFQYNVLKIGYPNTDTEDVNGRDEFNVTQTYTSPITRANKTLDLVSKVIASMYEIETTRINLDNKTTTDDTNDNKSFFLHVEKTATNGTGDEPATYYKLLRNTYTSVTGLVSPSTAFNLELHPELCLMRHGNFLRSIFYWQDAGNLVFQTSTKNGSVVVMNGTQKYIGNKTIRIGTLAAPLFIPIVFSVEGPMPENTVDVMDAGPDGTFSWEYDDGNIYYGFPLDVGIQPANRPAQETTLLCSPQTDITKLITISR